MGRRRVEKEKGGRSVGEGRKYFKTTARYKETNLEVLGINIDTKQGMGY